VRALLIVVPFAAAAGLTYWALLSGHDINFYLTYRPPEFTLAATVTVSVAVFVESPAAVAVTVTLPVEAGNVKSPVLSMDPAEVRHLTVELKAPLPVTVAVH